jgi:small subunit ribosomal protein S6
MFKYELMFIVKPDLEEANIKKVGEEMKSLVESNGAKVVDYKEMGQRELAYEINGYKNGYYFLIVIEAKDDKAVNEFSRVSLINENIIRNLVVKAD